MSTTAPHSEAHRSQKPERVGLELGIGGFSWPDLHDPHRLADLLAVFDQSLAKADGALCARYLTWRDSDAATTGAVELSELVVAVAPHLSRFLGQLFGIERELAELEARLRGESVVFRFQRDFLRRRAFQRFKSTADLGGDTFASLDERAIDLLRVGWPELDLRGDAEHATATAVMGAYDLEAALRSDGIAAGPVASQAEALLERLAADPRTAALTRPSVLEGLRAVLDLFERWCFARAHDTVGQAEVRHWASYHRPASLDYQNLVQIRPSRPATEGAFEGPAEHRRRRDGFELTDRRMGEREVLGEVHYCIFCHERDKDSCTKGIFDKTGKLAGNPLGIPLAGCPLCEKISEAHFLMREGDPLAALAAIAIDNPMAPGTGHRICNDCMKSCIYQKQEPVNIPQIETRILTSVLDLPWGFELWSLLTRFNPLNPQRPVALPCNGLRVLVVGMGPAGYTLAHYLLNEGFTVVGIDGLKIELLPAELTGSPGVPPRPVRDVKSLEEPLDERRLVGFGGVSEYGITVRWDKNFLKLLHLNLMRRSYFRLYGGVRFGGTLSIEEAWKLGFDHIAIAAGAGKPTVIEATNRLARGVRTASDFLMALQLTGAFKADSLANLQVRLPAVVIGGGLTAIDTGTELMAYYPIQVEKTLERFEVLAAELGRETLLAEFDVEERGVLATFLAHGEAVRAERVRAAAAAELPDLARLVREWGGVAVVYRKRLVDAPAYRLNHEEVAKALEEGIEFVERLSPLAIDIDEYRAASAVVFARQALQDGRWRASGEQVRLEARTVLMAVGTSPNVIYEREHPGSFKLDDNAEFFLAHRAVPRPGGGFGVEPVGSGPETGFFTSYADGGRVISYYGDNHPTYAGNVVKAMASAKDGYPRVVELFAERIANLDPAAEPDRLAAHRELVERLDEELLAHVAEVIRLTPTIVEVVVRAPLAARRFRPGQFYRLQNYEASSPLVDGQRLQTEGLALTGAWVDPARGLLSTIVLEMGTSSRLVAALRVGEPVVLMGPTGAPTEIPRGERVLLAGGGLGNAVLFSIARALRDNGCEVVYFAGYKKGEDLFKREDIEAGTDQVIWSVDRGEPIAARRSQDLSFVGNIVQAMVAYHEGRLGGPPRFPLDGVDRIIAIGSDRMMAGVKGARHGVLAPYLRAHVALGSINSPMQCMMKEVCGQCLQLHIDPETGKQSYVFSCFNQDQHLDQVDFPGLADRLRANSVQEKLANRWLDRLLTRGALARV